MSEQTLMRSILAATISTLVLMLGCKVLHEAGVPGLDKYGKPDPATVATERQHREEFLLHQRHESLYWLLSNKISNGMMLQEVEAVLGMPGERTTDFDSAKSNGLRQQTDAAYRWGPDRSGCSVVIWFRDGRVSNFNPKHYRDT